MLLAHLHANTRIVIVWSDRMERITGFCAMALCEALGASCDIPETQDGDPSNEAILLAQRWETQPSLATPAIKRRCRACRVGCHMKES